MGSSGGGSANPMFLSQGGVPMPNIPIAGQTGELKPQERGSFQSFLPDILPAGGGRNPSATGLTSDMFQYRSPQGVTASGSGSSSGGAASGGGGGGGGDAGQIDQLRQQLASLQTQVGNGQFGAARGSQEFPNIPLGWLNSNNPNATS